MKKTWSQIFSETEKSFEDTRKKAEKELLEVRKKYLTDDIRRLSLDQLNNYLMRHNIHLYTLRTVWSSSPFWYEYFEKTYTQELHQTGFKMMIDQFFRSSYLLLHFDLEYILQIYCNFIFKKKGTKIRVAKISFDEIYTILKGTIPQELGDALKILQNSRDSMHNAGIFNGRDIVLTYKGIVYEFNFGKKVNMTYEFLRHLVEDVLKLYLTLASHHQVEAEAHIKINR